MRMLVREAARPKSSPGLAVTPAWHPSEREAERVADQVMRMPAPAVQRTCACGGVAGPDGECAECRSRRLGLQRSGQGAASAAAPVAVHATLATPGTPLPAADRAFMETRFGYDFGSVRVHHDAQADASARAVDALAYTVGRDIVFGAGSYAPGTAGGRRLLAHELAHVVQQDGAPPRIQRIPRVERDPVHGPLVERYRRERGLPPGGAGLGGQREGPTDSEILRSDDFRDWMRHGDVPSPGAAPSLAAVPEVFSPSACGNITAQTPPAQIAAWTFCNNHVRFVNLLAQIASNIGNVRSPYAPGIAALYRAVLTPVTAAGPRGGPTPGAPVQHTLTQVPIRISARSSVTVPRFTLELQAGGALNGQFLSPDTMSLYESSASALNGDVADVERTAYHEMIHFFMDLHTPGYQPAGMTSAGRVRTELNLGGYEGLRAQFVAAATPLMGEALSTLQGTSVARFARRPNGAAALADAQFQVMRSEMITRIEEAVYGALRAGRGFARADVLTLPQPWLHNANYWSPSDPGWPAFLAARSARIDTDILPAVQRVQQAYLDQRPVE